MSMRIALDAVTEDAGSLSHPRRQGVAVAVHSAEAGAVDGDASLRPFLTRDPGVFTGGAVQVESTPRGQVAVHRNRARRRACNARQGRRLRLRDRAAYDQRPHSALTAAVTPDPAPQPPSPIRRKAVHPS